MASTALLSWIQSTILIENDWGEKGSGFLVVRNVGKDKEKAFLITNKHVLNKDPQLRNEAQEIKIYVNMHDDNNFIVGRNGTFPLHYADNSCKWREHPDPDADVMAFDATSLIINFPQLEKKMADYSVFADSEKLKEYDIDIGDDVFIIGYPMGLKQGKTNYPLVRSGTIATRIGETIQDTIYDNGIPRQRTVNGFLIDGATIPGSSGSPVILKPITGRAIQGKLIPSEAPALLLGIVADTYYAPVETKNWNIQSFANIGLAFSADIIKETIELFFK